MYQLPDPGLRVSVNGVQVVVQFYVMLLIVQVQPLTICNDLSGS